MIEDLPPERFDEIVPLFRALHVFHTERAPLVFRADAAESVYRDTLLGLHAQGGWVLAAASGWGLVGYLLALPATPPSGGLMQPVRRLRLEHLYVAPGGRGRGLGGALIEAMKARMAGLGIVQWSVSYHAFNTEAGRLYARHGAEPAVVTAAGRIAWGQAPTESRSRSTMPR